MTTVLLLLHVLVFVYWLGGDLGAFYASGFVTDPGRAPGERSLALSILNGVDTAPTVALVLALPTGLVLAVARGWLPLSPRFVATVVFGALVWAVLAVTIHRGGHPQARRLARVDLALRIAFIGALTIVGIGGVARLAGIATPWSWVPLFISIKCLLLASATALGLGIRRALRPFIPAFHAVVTTGSTAELEARVAASMAHCRRLVLALWACLLGAAYVGLAVPV